MTPDELGAFADAATPLTAKEGRALAAYRTANSTDANDERAEAYDRANETLERMAPDLARLCAEMGKALEAALGYVDEPTLMGECDAALTKLSELKAP